MLTLQDVTLTGGLAKGGDSDGGGGGAGMGGAIFNQGTVLIENSTLTGNTAQGGSSVMADGVAGPGGGGIGTESFDGLGGAFGPSAIGTFACSEFLLRHGWHRGLRHRRRRRRGLCRGRERIHRRCPAPPAAVADR